MVFYEFFDENSENEVYINPNQVVCVRPGNRTGTSDIITTANANGLHVITVTGDPVTVLNLLQPEEN